MKNYSIIVLNIFLLLIITFNFKKNIYITHIDSEAKSLNIEYKFEINKAFILINNNKKIINKVLNNLNNIQKIEIISIGFPEIIRWNEFGDIIENNLNIYSKENDFSIGIFQMKPSFIKNIEIYLINNNLIKKDNILNEIIVPKSVSSFEKRKIILTRMKNIEWQIKYLYAYWVIANHKYKSLQFNNNIDRINFYSAAYNIGFTKRNDIINSMRTRNNFPYRKTYLKKCFTYSEFSIFFFNNFNF